MKITYSIAALTVVILTTGSMITSCMDSKTKVNDVTINASEAKEKYEEDKQAYLEDIKKYKKQMDAELESNKKHISELKADKIAQGKASYREKIEALDQENARMENKINQYQDHGSEKWKSFKAEFSRDMDSLEKSVKDFTIKNNK